MIEEESGASRACYESEDYNESKDNMNATAMATNGDVDVVP